MKAKGLAAVWHCHEKVYAMIACSSLLVKGAVAARQAHDMLLHETHGALTLMR